MLGVALHSRLGHYLQPCVCVREFLPYSVTDVGVYRRCCYFSKEEEERIVACDFIVFPFLEEKMQQLCDIEAWLGLFQST